MRAVEIERQRHTIVEQKDDCRSSRVDLHGFQDFAFDLGEPEEFAFESSLFVGLHVQSVPGQRDARQGRGLFG